MNLIQNLGEALAALNSVVYFWCPQLLFKLGEEVGIKDITEQLGALQCIISQRPPFLNDCVLYRFHIEAI